MPKYRCEYTYVQWRGNYFRAGATQLTFCLVMFGEVDMFPHDILSVLRSGSSTPSARPNRVYEQAHIFVCVKFRCNPKQNKHITIYLRKIFNETSSKRFLHASWNEKVEMLKIKAVLSPFYNEITWHSSTLSKRKSNSETVSTDNNVLFRWLRFGLLFCGALQNQ